MGYKVYETPGSGDRGIDCIAIDPTTGEKVLIQSKRYYDLVKPDVVREMYGTLILNKGDRGVVVTTGRFSAETREMAADIPIELVDGEQLRALLAQYLDLNVIIGR